MIGQKQATLTSPMQAAARNPSPQRGSEAPENHRAAIHQNRLVAHLKLQLIQIARLCVTEPDQDLHLMAIEEAIGVIPLQGPPKLSNLRKCLEDFRD